MTLEQLRVFVEVAERLHVTRAAAVLNMDPVRRKRRTPLETRLGDRVIRSCREAASS